MRNCRLLMKLTTLLFFAGVWQQAFAALPCPTSMQLSKMQVKGRVIPHMYYSMPVAIAADQCEMAWSIIANSKTNAQEALAKAKYYSSRTIGNLENCSYDKAPNHNIGLINVFTYKKVNGLCTKKMLPLHS